MLLYATISPPTCVTTLQLDLCNGAATRLKLEKMIYPITTVCLRANSETLADFLQKVSAFFPARHSLLRFSSAFICETPSGKQSVLHSCENVPVRIATSNRTPKEVLKSQRSPREAKQLKKQCAALVVNGTHPTYHSLPSGEFRNSR